MTEDELNREYDEVRKFLAELKDAKNKLEVVRGLSKSEKVIVTASFRHFQDGDYLEIPIDPVKEHLKGLEAQILEKIAEREKSFRKMINVVRGRKDESS